MMGLAVAVNSTRVALDSTPEDGLALDLAQVLRHRQERQATWPTI